MSGFYLMHRNWQDNPVFNNEPFSRRDAWVWLIENANYADGKIGVAGRTVSLKRGQLCRPLRKIAEAWQWDEAKVRRFLARLKGDAMIECVSDAKSTVITVCNYDEYQVRVRVGDAPTDAILTHERRVTDAPTKEGKELSQEADASLGEAPALDIDGADKPANVTPLPKATRLPSDWTVPDKWIAWAVDQHMAAEIAAREAAKFADYWHAKAGKDGLKNDWFATWRNWIRRVTEGGYGQRGGHQRAPQRGGNGFLDLRRQQGAGGSVGKPNVVQPDGWDGETLDLAPAGRGVA